MKEVDTVPSVGPYITHFISGLESVPRG